MLAYPPMLPHYYYAQNHASIIRQGVVKGQGCGTEHVYSNSRKVLVKCRQNVANYS